MKYQAPIGAADPNDPYEDGNPGTGTPGSPVPAAAIEDPMREIVNAIAAGGLTPDSEDLTQLSQLLAAFVKKTSATGSMQVPVGTTAQRNGSPSIGDWRENATTGSPERWNGTAWDGFGGGGVGIGQTWQDVKASRAISTTYTNTSGKPIMVAVVLTNSSTNSIGVDGYVDGMVVQSTAVYGQGNGYKPSVCFIVPDGSTFKAEKYGAASYTVDSWKELR